MRILLAAFPHDHGVCLGVESGQYQRSPVLLTGAGDAVRTLESPVPAGLFYFRVIRWCLCSRHRSSANSAMVARSAMAARISRNRFMGIAPSCERSATRTWTSLAGGYYQTNHKNASR